MITIIDAYILAGGLSERMGKDKVLLDLYGRPLIDWCVANVGKIFASVFAVVKDTADMSVAGIVPVVRDVEAVRSPLVGILAALQHTAKPAVFIKACDNPFINAELAAHMVACIDNADIVIPRTADGLHPLFGVYSSRCTPVIEEMMRSRRYKVTGFFEHMNVRYIDEREVEKFDKNRLSLLNINTNVEFEKFKRDFPLDIVEGGGNEQ